ncbi:MAG: Gmad2 immunoglobulin-like domain-containing protein [Minisyncoccia bacterium]
MNKKYSILLAFILVVGGGFLIFKSFQSRTANQIACTMEARQCPDGSYVGRTGPKCEFAACPSAFIYTNAKYGFSVTLPKSWSGYSVVVSTREVRDIKNNIVVSNIPTINIRHPLWTKEVPRQDIPVDVYTISLWAGIVSGKYSVGAAPIPPLELTRNSQYVFALPARYNYAFPEGYKEVEKILQGKPVKALDLGFVYKNANADLIQVELPYPEAVVGKEFSIMGKARGNWYFEASFPVVLLDKDGQVLAQGAAQAQGNWMTTEFVPFKIVLKVTNNNYIGKGTLVLKKDNPSGDSSRDASVSFNINIEY